jgi:hypothetical protein
MLITGIETPRSRKDSAGGQRKRVRNESKPFYCLSQTGYAKVAMVSILAPKRSAPGLVLITEGIAKNNEAIEAALRIISSRPS